MENSNKLIVASIFLPIMFVLMYVGITPDTANASTSGSIIMNYDYDGGTDADCGLLLANNLCIPIGDGIGYNLGPQTGQWDNCLNSAVKYASGLSDISGLQVSYEAIAQQPPACISNEGHSGDETPLMTFTTYKVSFVPKCTPNNTKQCVGNSVYNFDSCGTQGSLYQTCYQGQTCQNGQCVNVTCSNNSNCGTNAYTGSPYCQGGDIYQNYKTFTCNNPGTVNSSCSDSTAPQLKSNCASNQTCTNGQCITNPNIVCSSNSQCGTNSYIDSPYCQGNSTYQNYKTYTCQNPGTASSYCTDSVSAQLKSNCTASQTCDDGQCKNANIACSINAQCGTDGYPNSSYCKGGNVYQDYKTYTCLNPGTASSFCFNSTSVQLKNNCNANQTCDDGQCKNANIACSTNSQCGTNAYTGSPYCQNGDIYQNYKTYVCNNPGTANSTCSDSTAPQLKSNCASGQTCTNGSCLTSNITCSTSAQCGNNALTGNPFCQGNNVFTNQLTYYCNNPGTSQSFCSSLLVPQLTKSCGTNKTCSNGDCASQSIACGSNADCGSNGLTGNAFCQDDGVYKNYITYSCNNPGTSQSFCSNSTTPQLTQTCSTNQSCVNGSCTNLNIACSINAQCGTDVYTDSPYCQGNGIYQNYKTYTCLNPGTGNSFCSNSTAPKSKSNCAANQTCDDGQCKNVNFTCSTDSGCGTNDYTGGLFCIGNSIYKNFKTYTCNNPATANSSCSQSTQPLLISNCPTNQTCSLGVCSNTTINCSTNSQCGTNAYTGSPYCQNGDIYQNYKTFTCNNPGTANSVCSDSTAPQLKDDCTANQTCANGQCQNVTIACSTNAQCGTNAYVGSSYCQNGDIYQNYKTYTCSNPGTANSVCSDSTAPQLKSECTGNQTCTNGQCTNVTINCSTNSQCGTNAFTGSPYCQGGDIYQNYKTYTCNNPGTANSVCSDSTAPQLKSNCTGNQTCTNGSCTNVNIACSTNAGCGTNAYVGSSYCQNGDIYQNYKTYTCNNPGTANSVCSDSTAPQLKSNCTGNQTCSNGSCTNQNIICSNNSDCGTNNYTGNLYCQGNNVYQSYMTYTCNNAGTSSSYCSNSTASQFRNSCTGNQTCSNGSCSGTNCTYHSYQQCLGNNLYWFNSCGVQQDLIQYCQNGCSNNTCNNNQQSYLAVQTNSATNTYNNQATLNGYLSGTNTNDINYVWFQWGTTTSYGYDGYETNHQTKNYTGPFSQNIAGLTPGVVYHFRAVAQGSNGQIIYGQDMTFQLGQVLGATNVSTGLTNNFLLDSFFLPLMIAIAGIWLFKSGIVNVGAWADGKKMKRIDYFASKKLKTKIAEIKEKEGESWPQI